METEKKRGPLGPNQRWSARRKRDAVLRLLQGEPLDALSRELGVEIYRLDAWRNQALDGMERALKKRDGDPLFEELNDLLRGLKLVGELTPRSLDLVASFGERLSVRGW